MISHTYRPRRLRENIAVRQLVRESQLLPQKLIYPLFIKENIKEAQPIAQMPGQFQHSFSSLKKEIKNLKDLGVSGILLFGIPSLKYEHPIFNSSQHFLADALALIKDQAPDMLLMADVCLCEYTSHGHCGLMNTEKKGHVILNDESLQPLAEMALMCAQAGADVIAPSDMMDGRIQAMRSLLDAESYSHLPILSYAVKYASSFYGPFRHAAESTPAFGDRRSYQMDSANLREAITEAALDLEEGADMLMIKPASHYLDVLYALKQEFHCPIAAYQVSGEYSMIKAAAAQGWIDEKKVVLESLQCFFRAGADFVFSYFTKDLMAQI